MTEPGQVRRRFFLLLAPLVCASVALPAAGAGAAEGTRLSAAEVAEALGTIQVIAGDVVSSGTNNARASMIVEGVDPIWERIEATIKANHAGSYETLEEGLESLAAAAAAGDPAKAGGSAGVIAGAVKSYLTKFPGDGMAAAPSPTPSGDRTAAAASTTARTETRAAAPSKAEPLASEGRTAAADTPADAGGTLARTGGTSTLAALAGSALGLGGLSVIAGARRRPSGAA